MQPAMMPVPERMLVTYAAVLLTVEEAKAGKSGTWMMGQPCPHLPKSKIARMILVDDCVEVFAREDPGAQVPAQPEKGIHVTLLPPRVAFVMLAGSMAAWNAAKQGYDEDEDVTEVVAAQGAVWALDHPAPVDPEIKVVRMVLDGETVRVFCLPNTGSPLENYGICYVLMPLTIERVTAKAGLSNWAKIQADFDAMALREEQRAPAPSDDDPEEGDEIDDPLEPPPAVAAPQQPAALAPTQSAIAAAITPPNGQG